MNCQCYNKDRDVGYMEQCRRCLAVLCGICYQIHKSIDEEISHICHKCPLPIREEKERDEL